MAKLGTREPKAYESVQAAVDARTSGTFAMKKFGAEALVRRGGTVDEHTGSFHFTHDTRANVSYMLCVLTDEQAAELMEQVPRSLVLCAESVRPYPPAFVRRNTPATSRIDRIVRHKDSFTHHVLVNCVAAGGQWRARRQGVECNRSAVT